jgi:2-dehydro-3-deoxygalactonokinase
MTEVGRGFVSCDWGTTNLRLRWMDAATGAIAGEVSSAEGVRHAYDRAHAGGGFRAEAYYEILARNLARLEHGVGHSLDGVPVLVSGMASSSIGIEELPYAALPFSLGGEDIIHRTLDRLLPGGQRVVLFSGVRTADDVMRGEETQLIGLAGSAEPDDGPAVYLLPGTHSKHAVVEGSALQSFSTHLTGELFEAVTSHTILRDSVERPAPGQFSRGAFQEGVRAGVEDSLLHALFLGRSNALFSRFGPVENYWFLSGAVIGTEVAVLASGPPRRIRLCAGAALRPLYEAALEALGLADRVESVPAAQVDESAARGHLVLHRRLELG